MQFNKDSVTRIFHNVNLIGSSPSPVPTALLLGSSNERSQKCSSSRVKSRGSKHAMMERSHQGGKRTLTPSSEGWWDMILSRKEVHVEANCWKWPWWESLGISHHPNISKSCGKAVASSKHFPSAWTINQLSHQRGITPTGSAGSVRNACASVGDHEAKASSSSSRLWEFYKDNITYFIRAWLTPNCE